MKLPSREEVTRIANRALLEFAPPVLIGLVWVFIRWPAASSITDHIAAFGGAFLIVGWVWGNLLRIHHQQTQKHQQTGIANDVGALAALI
jgi:hypothetical protein